MEGLINTLGLGRLVLLKWKKQIALVALLLGNLLLGLLYCIPLRHSSKVALGVSLNTPGDISKDFPRTRKRLGLVLNRYADYVELSAIRTKKQGTTLEIQMNEESLTLTLKATSNSEQQSTQTLEHLLNNLLNRSLDLKNTRISHEFYRNSSIAIENEALKALENSEIQSALDSEALRGLAIDYSRHRFKLVSHRLKKIWRARLGEEPTAIRSPASEESATSLERTLSEIKIAFRRIAGGRTKDWVLPSLDRYIAAIEESRIRRIKALFEEEGVEARAWQLGPIVSVPSIGASQYRWIFALCALPFSFATTFFLFFVASLLNRRVYTAKDLFALHDHKHMGQIQRIKVDKRRLLHSQNETFTKLLCEKNDSTPVFQLHSIRKMNPAIDAMVGFAQEAMALEKKVAIITPISRTDQRLLKDNLRNFGLKYDVAHSTEVKPDQGLTLIAPRASSSGDKAPERHQFLGIDMDHLLQEVDVVLIALEELSEKKDFHTHAAVRWHILCFPEGELGFECIENHLAGVELYGHTSEALTLITNCELPENTGKNQNIS